MAELSGIGSTARAPLAPRARAVHAGAPPVALGPVDAASDGFGAFSAGLARGGRAVRSAASAAPDPTFHAAERERGRALRRHRGAAPIAAGAPTLAVRSIFRNAAFTRASRSSASSSGEDGAWPTTQSPRRRAYSHGDRAARARAADAEHRRRRRRAGPPAAAPPPPGGESGRSARAATAVFCAPPQRAAAPAAQPLTHAIDRTGRSSAPRARSAAVPDNPARRDGRERESGLGESRKNRRRQTPSSGRPTTRAPATRGARAAAPRDRRARLTEARQGRRRRERRGVYLGRRKRGRR